MLKESSILFEKIFLLSGLIFTIWLIFNKIFLYNLEAKYFDNLSFAKLLFSSIPYNDETLPVFIELEILPDLIIFVFNALNILKSIFPFTIFNLLLPLFESALLVLNDKFVFTINLVKFLS